MCDQDSFSAAFHVYLRKKTNWSIGVLEYYFQEPITPILDHSMSPCLLFFSACQRFFDDVANRIELFDPFGIQPKKFGSLNAARLVAHFLFRDVLSQGIIEAAGLVIGVQPGSLPLPGQQPVHGNFSGVGMGCAVE